MSDVLHASQGLRGVPETMPKATYLEYELQGCLAEGRGMDLIEMGRPEGAACYCSANHLLRNYMDRLMGAYRSVVVDNEAGMEHLSRRTTRDVDLLLIVSDATGVGIRSAQRIRRTACMAHHVTRRAPRGEWATRPRLINLNGRLRAGE